MGELHRDMAGPSAACARAISGAWRLPVLAAVALALSGCSSRIEYTDVSGDPEYAPIVGTRYEVVGNLTAYGVRRDYGGPVGWVTAKTAPGFDGPEAGFRHWVPPGTMLTVRRVLDSNVLDACQLVLEVEFDARWRPWSADLPVRVPLYGATGSDDCDGRPSPAILRPLPA